MRINGIDHYNIAGPAELIERVRDFYVDVLTFVEGERPQFSSGGYWLYAGGSALVHLRVDDAPDTPRVDSTHSYCDHIALACAGLEAFEGRLDAAGVPFRKNYIADAGQYQLFVRDPAGVGVELNFRE